MAPAAIVSAIPVPASTTMRGPARQCFVLRRRVHREHDAQVDERTDHRREHADDREPVLTDVDRGAEHRELGDETAGERNARLREEEQGEQPREHGPADAEPP